jgi:parvulin-like peptidyl-prolyl isomerase
LRVQETVNALLAKVGEGVVVADEEVQTFFANHPRAVDPGEKLKIRHILVRVPPDASERAREALRVKAGIVANRARAGDDFEALVREFSYDTETKGRGGRLEIRRGDTAGIDQAAFARSARYRARRTPLASASQAG